MFVAISILLFLTGLLVTEYYRSRQVELSERPLDLDEGLSVAWAGHASSVFSLTGLFGAYLGIFLFLGMWAILGIMLGSIAALIAIRSRVLNSGHKQFESFLESLALSRIDIDNSAFRFFLALTQIGFAASELVILRELAIAGFLISERDASIYALAAGLVAYIYCLKGGYRALYHTDVIQLYFVIAMCLVVSSFALWRIYDGGFVLSQSLLTPESSEWSLGLETPIMLVALKLLIGLVMGWSFLVASPDTWKRVFTVAVVESERKQFAILMVAGVAPFALLLPIGLSLRKIPTERLLAMNVLVGTDENLLVTVALFLGLTASFLSSFDSALIAAVHVALTRSKRTKGATSPLGRYQFNMGTAFLLAVVGAVLFSEFFGNPYLLGLLLIGPYAYVAGIITGTGGLRTPIKRTRLLEETLVFLFIWLFAVCWITGGFDQLVSQITEEHLKAVPLGVLFFVLTAVWSLARRMR